MKACIWIVTAGFALAGVGASAQQVDQPAPPHEQQAPPLNRAPRKLSGKNPVYPAEAKKNHVSGIVRMRILVAEDGTVENVTVLDGPELLRQASIDAVFTWTYSPGIRKGKIVEMETVVSVNFNVN